MSRPLPLVSTLFALVFTTVACAELPADTPPESSAGCPAPSGVSLQVLGSGGPIADDGRSSAGYIVWVDGRSAVLIDAGGGTFLRFGEAGASFADLDVIGLSHLHADHSADFPALLKSGNFSGRERPLTVAGPDAGGPFPGFNEYLAGMLDPERGVYRYLSGYLDGSRGLPKLDAIEVSDDSRTTVVFDGDIRVTARHVPHGIVPAVAFRVTVDNEVSIVFASDQNGSDAGFVDFAKDADALVMHMPIPEGATGSALQLHALPSVIADIASNAEAKRLVLSHFMARSLKNLDDNVQVVRAGYDGPVTVADDLTCLRVGD